MVETTTVKVAVSTRDRLRARAAVTRQSADEVIRDGLAALERELERTQMRARALELAQDPDDVAELQAAARDMDAVRAR